MPGLFLSGQVHSHRIDDYLDVVITLTSVELQW